ncbi:hypothetical protein D9757_015225 [Collybiopsis confluens]|uniref:Zn(2)-C6 fungal-type domain-containing protein n=1 Tax=Collybiopsis confluens TaxID=2823264 RepID=A0A8H5C9U5_9AGAR|nr:hypothetical protein D9757_015225 [Collybiopsis confluens]
MVPNTIKEELNTLLHFCAISYHILPSPACYILLALIPRLVSIKLKHGICHGLYHSSIGDGYGLGFEDIIKPDSVENFDQKTANELVEALGFEFKEDPTPSFFDVADFSPENIDAYQYPALATDDPFLATNKPPRSFYPAKLAKWYKPVEGATGLTYAKGVDLYRATNSIFRAFKSVFAQRNRASENDLHTRIESALATARPALTYMHQFWASCTNCPNFAVVIKGMAQYLVLTYGDSSKRTSQLKGWKYSEEEMENLERKFQLSDDEYPDEPPIPLDDFHLEGLSLWNAIGDKASEWFTFPGQVSPLAPSSNDSSKEEETQQLKKSPAPRYQSMDPFEEAVASKSVPKKRSNPSANKGKGKALPEVPSRSLKRSRNTKEEEDDEEESDLILDSEEDESPKKRVKSSVPTAKFVLPPHASRRTLISTPRRRTSRQHLSAVVIKPEPGSSKRPAPASRAKSRAVAASRRKTPSPEPSPPPKGKRTRTRASLGVREKIPAGSYQPSTTPIPGFEGVAVTTKGDPLLIAEQFVPEETNFGDEPNSNTNGPKLRTQVAHVNIDKRLLGVGSLVGVNNFNMNYSDIPKMAYPLPQPARLSPSGVDQRCTECIRLKTPCNYEKPHVRCGTCQSNKTKCLKTLDLEEGLPVMNAMIQQFKTAPNNAQSRFETARDARAALMMAHEALNAQVKAIDRLTEHFVQCFGLFSDSMSDPMIVLKSLGSTAGDEPVARFSYEHFSFLATVFDWNSPLNFGKIDTGDRTLQEWLELVRESLDKVPGPSSPVPNSSPTALPDSSATTLLEDSIANARESVVDIGIADATGSGSLDERDELVAVNHVQIILPKLKSYPFAHYHLLLVFMPKPKILTREKEIHPSLQAISKAYDALHEHFIAISRVYPRPEKNPPSLTKQKRFRPFVEELYNALTENVTIREHARVPHTMQVRTEALALFEDSIPFIPNIEHDMQTSRLTGFMKQLDAAVNEYETELANRQRTPVNPDALKYIRTGKSKATGESSSKVEYDSDEPVKTSKKGKKRKVESAGLSDSIHASSTQSRSDIGTSDSARVASTQIYVADLRTETEADEAPFSHSLGAHPGDDPAALEYLMGKLVRLEFDSTNPAALESAHAAHSQFPGWCHYMPLRPAELARLIKFQESLTRLGHYETIPNLRHLAWERCNCHKRERENPISVQLLDEVATTLLGEFKDLPTGVLNSLLNYHRVEGLHATHIALLHHDRAKVSRRICDEVRKEFEARMNLADKSEPETGNMDTEKTQAIIVPACEDVEINSPTPRSPVAGRSASL